MAERARERVPPPFQVYWQVHWDRPPWQLAAAWAGLCGFFLAVPRPFAAPWWVPLLVALLVDPLWGAWWRIATAPASGAGGLPPMPYARPGAPWSLWSRVVATGTVTGFLLTAVAAGGVVHFLGPESIWPTLVAAALALAAWWTVRVLPGLMPYLEAVYALGLPLWAGASIAGAWERAAWLAAAVVLLAWAHVGEKRVRLLLGLAGTLAWGWAVHAWAPTWFTGLILVGSLLSVFSQTAARGRTVWWALLLATVASRWVVGGGA